jgi:hypothetical protein
MNVNGYTDDAVVTFGRNPANGALTWLGRQQDGMNIAHCAIQANAQLVKTTPTARHAGQRRMS